jgi:hypothetical protein
MTTRLWKRFPVKVCMGGNHAVCYKSVKNTSIIKNVNTVHSDNTPILEKTSPCTCLCPYQIQSGSFGTMDTHSKKGLLGRYSLKSLVVKWLWAVFSDWIQNTSKRFYTFLVKTCLLYWNGPETTGFIAPKKDEQKPVQFTANEICVIG